MKTSFETIVRKMSAKEIILAMVDSLIPPPAISVDMSSFGGFNTIAQPVKFLGITIRPRKTICYGCAATNTICKIAGKTFTELNIDSRIGRADFIKSDYHFLTCFEEAIDALRKGQISLYNSNAIAGGFDKIKQPDFSLPILRNSYTIEELDAYKKLAEIQ